MRRRSEAGFTLAELLVATLLISIVMSGVYFTFSSSIRLWRNGEADLQTYQDARTSMTIMTRELMQLLEGSGHLIEGDDNELLFYAVAPPFHSDGEYEGPRILEITYRTRPNAKGPGRILVREERAVEGAMPVRPKDDETDIDTGAIKRGPSRKFDLAEGVMDLEFTYIWVGEQETPDASDLGGEIPEPKMYELDEHREGDGVPQGIRIKLTLADAVTEKGETTFTTYAVFQGPTDEYEEPGFTS